MNKQNDLQIIREYSAGIVLFKEKDGRRKYLILHYPGGHFDFPKGHLESGETEKQAAIRELHEETGIEITDIYPGFEEKIVFSFWRGASRVDKTVTFFLAETSTPKVTISHEHKGYLWLEYSEAVKKITFGNAKRILTKAEELLQHFTLSTQ